MGIDAFKIDTMVKSFKDFKLGPVSLDLQPGQVLGLAGPNGAGKTTLIHCLAGLLLPEQGSLKIFGRQVNHKNPEWKYDIGYVSDEPVFYENWTGRKNLEFIAGFYPDWSWDYADELINRFNCPVEKKATLMSKGNRTKLSLISVLARKPKLLLLDEPTDGLDPPSRAELAEVLWKLLEKTDQTILYSTHVLSEIDKMADELTLLIDGKIVLRVPKDQLRESWRRISFRLDGDFQPAQGIFETHCEGDMHYIISSHGNETVADLKRRGAGQITESRMTLEEIMVQMMREKSSC